MYVPKVFVSLGYCWPSEIFDPGSPSQVAEPSLRHRSNLSMSPLPKVLSFPLVLLGLTLLHITCYDGHALMKTCQNGPEKAACL